MHLSPSRMMRQFPPRDTLYSRPVPLSLVESLSASGLSDLTPEAHQVTFTIDDLIQIGESSKGKEQFLFKFALAGCSEEKARNRHPWLNFLCHRFRTDGFIIPAPTGNRAVREQGFIRKTALAIVQHVVGQGAVYECHRYTQ